MEKLTKMDRAKQFAPFASLRGYGDLIRQKEFPKTVKKELTEEETDMLNATVAELKKGDMAEVTYYCSDRYKTVVGVVTAIDKTLRDLTVVKTKIKFDDVAAIKVII